VVLALEDPVAGKRLVAYVVPAGGAAPTTNGLRRFLAARLPYYMIPSEFVVVASLPLTPNGKIDRAALTVLATTAPAAAQTTAGVALEPALGRIWADVLGIDAIGWEDDFFDLGDHSLAALQVISRVSGEFDVQLELDDLFEARTVADLANLIRRRQSTRERTGDLLPLATAPAGPPEHS
jgi:acyl carrier protein